MDMKSAALQYALIGWEVFPVYEMDGQRCSCGHDCGSPGKHPRVINGLLDATSEVQKINEWWTRWPNANIGVKTGHESGITVMDIDDMDQKRLHDIPKTVSSRTGSGGEHHIFAYPGEHVKTVARVFPGLDSRGDGGYIIVPPSNHASGNCYEWVESPFDGCELGDAPEWWLRAVKEYRKEKKIVPVSTEITEGGRNQGVFDFGVKIWKKVPMSETALYGSLSGYNLSVCKPPLDDREVMTIAQSIVRYEGKTREQWEEDQRLARDGAQIAEAIMASHQRKIAEALVNKVTRTAGPPPDFMPDNGLIRDVAEYIISQSERPLPLLAVASAACLVGVLAGGKYETHNRLGPNLMFIGLAGSGSGKQKARSIISNMAYDLGLTDLLGADDIASAPGLIAEMADHPNKLFMIDEFGLALQSITSKNAGGYKREIMSTIMKLYSSYSTTYNGTAYADKKNRPKQIIKSPCLVIYGTSTHKTFYDALTSDQGSDGFISRLLVVPCEEGRGKRVKVKYHGIPGNIKAKVLELGGIGFPDGKFIVPMMDGVEDAFIDLDEAMTALMVDYKEIKDQAESVYSRVAENATKLALVYAVSKDFTDPVIDHKAYAWGREIALWCANHIMEKLVENVADNEIERDHKKMVKHVDDAGAAGITKRELQRRFLKLRAFERDEMIASLIGMGFMFEKNGRLYGASQKELLEVEE